MALTKIISGGQTGVDRGALDAALALGFTCGGWCPADRQAEDGIIPEHYPLTALESGGYRQRTRKNVQDSDGTVILYLERLSGGTEFTRDMCDRSSKPFVAFDAALAPPAMVAQAIVEFVARHRLAILNVAGPRLSGWPSGYEYAVAVISQVISRFGPP